ncbi:MAG: hypothetical protein ABRQ23_07555 [Syntrophomonadaceae bacterium]
MNRMTREFEKGRFCVDEGMVKHSDNCYIGPAIDKLARFENMQYDLLAKLMEISQELEKLRGEGKTRSVEFKQLLATKMVNSNILIMLKTYGL